jgi:RNA polymerase sigma-70 factor (sigma-E family)
VGQNDDAPGDAYEDLYRRRRRALLRYGHALTGNPHDAADLVQEAFARLRPAWHRLGNHANAEAYVRTTMMRLQVSNWRRSRREHVVADLPEVGKDDPALQRVGDESGLWGQLRMLPPRQREVLLLRYGCGRSDKQIADMLDVTAVTIRSHARRGLMTLRERWYSSEQPPVFGRRRSAGGRTFTDVAAGTPTK